VEQRANLFELVRNSPRLLLSGIAHNHKVRAAHLAIHPWFGSLAPKAPVQGSSVANAAGPMTRRTRPIIEAAYKRLARVVSRFRTRAAQNLQPIAVLSLNAAPSRGGTHSRPARS